MDSSAKPDCIIELQNVTKHYQKIKALDGVSASIRPGTIGLLGPNGAGKSTLIKLLLGLVKMSSGRAEVLGYPTHKASHRIRQKVGYMPEDDFVIAGLKGIQTVAFAGELAGLPPLAALRRAHEMLDFVSLGEERYREVQTYSTGMRQKIKMAQALVHSPRLVFLDEPTGGLDPKGRQRMLRLISEMNRKRGISVMLSTHILEDVEACCDAVLILKQGQVKVYDSLENLRKTVDESVQVRFEGEGSELVAVLNKQGCQTESLGRDLLRVSRAGGPAAQHVWQAAAETQVIVRQLMPSRTSLEQIFLDSIREGADAGI